MCNLFEGDHSNMTSGSEEKHGAITVNFMLEQKPTEGEDSDPILRLHEGNWGLICVFDGMGGAGGTTYKSPDGNGHTGAYIASRLAKTVVEDHFDGLAKREENTLNINDIAKELKNALTKTFMSKVSEIDTSPSRVRSNLIRRLPTTMAAIYFEKIENQSNYYQHDLIQSLGSTRFVRCYSVWAGDSRSYVLTPEKGLQQVTQDDIKSKGDALENLMEDSPISNCINADTDFSLRHHSLNTPLPAVFLVATDGCFGYVPTPVHFEFLLLHSLVNSQSTESWKDNVIARLQEIAGDDVSMALVAMGWNDFKSLKRDFVDRANFIYKNYIEPIDEIEHLIRTLDSEMDEVEKKEHYLRRKREIRAELWEKYKKTYQFLKIKSKDTEL